MGKRAVESSSNRLPRPNRSRSSGAGPAVLDARNAFAIKRRRGFGASAGAKNLFVEHREKYVKTDGQQQPVGGQQLLVEAKPGKHYACGDDC